MLLLAGPPRDGDRGDERPLWLEFCRRTADWLLEVQDADGSFHRAYNADGSVALESPAKEVREFGGRQYVLEEGIVTDFALVRAARGDRHGNLSYDASARNFNPLCAMAGRITIAEVEELVEPGELDPEQVHTPGLFVQRVIEVGEDCKLIEKRTVAGSA